MARILIAASEGPGDMLARILHGHELVRVDTMSLAERLLGEQSFDGIVCTVVFDDSRMLDLLRAVKSSAAWRDIPFVCARLRLSVLASRMALDDVALACRSLGAAAFLNVADYGEDPEPKLRLAIEGLMGVSN
jgi:hypothetical protein